MDLFDILIALVVVGGAVALYFVYRKPNKVTHEGQAYRRQKDGSFLDAQGNVVRDPALGATLTGLHAESMSARDARLRKESDWEPD